MKTLAEGLRLHAHIIKNGLLPAVFISNKLIEIYSKNGLLLQARHLFERMPERNVFTWNAIIHGHINNQNFAEAQRFFDLAPEKDSVSYNSMISGYGGGGYDQQALELFMEMHRNGTRIDEFTLTTMLNLGAKLLVLEYGKQIHAHTVKTGNDLNCFGISSLIDMYSKCGCFSDAFQAFNGTSEKDSVSKNAMVAACCREGEMTLAFDLFRNVPGINDTISWNTLIAGFSQNGYGLMALELFIQMRKDGIRQNEHTFASVLTACSGLKSLKHGKEVHACIVKNGLSSNSFISSGIVDVYCKCHNLRYAESVHAAMQTENVFATTLMITAYSCQGDMMKARRLFDSLSKRNLVVWTALFSGYIRFRQSDAVFDLFREFRRKEKAVPDALILICMLGACAIQATLEHGKQIHGYIVRMGIEMEKKMTSAMVDMYAKCGDMKYSEKIFRQVASRDRVIYNALMAGYAHNDGKNEAIQLFEEMLQQKMKPDEVTFIALLSACRHAGLVETGEKYFSSMEECHSITPEIDHYSCMVDLFGRANCLDKALSLIEMMPLKPDAIIWGTFLNACRMHGNLDLARKAEEKLLAIEADNGARYVQLANAYAAEGEWSEMRRIRMKMRGKEAKKLAGCSWIYVGNKVNIFTSGDRSHLEAEAIYTMLASLNSEMMGSMAPA